MDLGDDAAEIQNLDDHAVIVLERELGHLSAIGQSPERRLGNSILHVVMSSKGGWPTISVQVHAWSAYTKLSRLAA
jgi:hypothetical protein